MMRSLLLKVSADDGSQRLLGRWRFAEMFTQLQTR